MNPLVERLGLTVPVIQAPMAGVSTPAMAAAVSEAGALGSIALGAGDAAAARIAIDTTRALTARPFMVNLFVHAAPRPDPAVESAWLDWLRPAFAEFDAEPPRALSPPYRSFSDDPAMLAMLLDMRPAVVSFHSGVPASAIVRRLRDAGMLTMASATSVTEARTVAAAGIDIVVAQGIEAGGHRGVFDPGAPDDALGTMALTRLLVRQETLPVVAAGAIMDGAGVAAMLALGASAAQLGTAFIACPESAADPAYRAALMGPGAASTRMTASISGRPARCLANRFTALDADPARPAVPAYPIAYDAGKALHAAARRHDEHGYGAQWAGQGAPLARALPAGKLIAALAAEYAAAGD